jgi:hypothetical protein
MYCIYNTLVKIINKYSVNIIFVNSNINYGRYEKKK